MARLRLENKVCLITGGARGVGYATAEVFLQEGAQVVITDINAEQGQQAADALGERAFFIQQDIASEADWARVMAEIISRYGRLDVLVNNAALLIWGSIEENTLQDFQTMHRVNAEGVFLGCKAAIAEMKQTGGGAIVNVSSIAALGGLAIFCAYSASKGSVTALTRSVAMHCKREGYKIRCNSVHPDCINTPMIQAPGEPLPDLEELKKDPMNRMCSPTDIANTILFLSCDDSSFVNGVEMRVDNGQLIGGIN